MGNRNWRAFLPWLIFFGVLFFIFQSMKQVQQKSEIEYSEFKQRLKDGQVRSVKVGETVLRGQFKGSDGTTTNFHTIRVDDPALPAELEKHDVKYGGEVDRNW